MLSKCANPECREQIRYLRQGKLFCLAPTSEVRTIGEYAIPKLSERFWLCDRCSKTMTLVWVGTHAKVVPLRAEPVAMPAVLSAKVTRRDPSAKRFARGVSRGR